VGLDVQWIYWGNSFEGKREGVEIGRKRFSTTIRSHKLERRGKMEEEIDRRGVSYFRQI
jgi:hypothetical protein